VLKPADGGVNLHCDNCDRPYQNYDGTTAVFADAEDAIETGHDSLWFTNPATGYALCGITDEAHNTAARDTLQTLTDNETRYRLYGAYLGALVTQEA